MREIKFRAWDTATLGWFDQTKSQGNILDTALAFRDDVVLMQYTGLKDKNGVEIYEGDIVRLWRTQEPDPVANDAPERWIALTTDVHWNPTGLNWNFWAPQSGEEWEVVGNTHENPEWFENE